jgi:tRNA(His) guanylyltransferase
VGDVMGDRMKGYEAVEAQRRLMPLLPAVVRLDGRGFSRWTGGLKRPFDPRLSTCMIELTRALVEETNARVGYTQSDEISLILYSNRTTSQLYFDGRVQKICSCLAGFAALTFAGLVRAHIPEKSARPAMFDCRVWNVPTLEEASNAILWREYDATKNSIEMAARCYYSHNALLGKHGGEMQELLHRKGVNWNDYPAFFKRGSYIQRRVITRAFTAEQIELLPPKHAARTNPNLVVERSEIRPLDLPPLNRVKNRVDVLIHGADPITGDAS